MSKVTAIIATYNGANIITDTLKSVLSQTKKTDIVVVDDGSTDDTLEIINGLNSSGSINIISQKNSGAPASPRNNGIKNSKGDFIAPCDQDDLWYKEKIEKQLEAYERIPKKDEVGIIICSADIINGVGKVIGRNLIKGGYLPPREAFEKLLNGDFITACSAMVPRRVLDDIGLFDESLKGVDDYDLWLRITKKYGVLCVPDVLCAWRKQEGSLSAIKSDSYLNTEEVFSKLGDRTEAIKKGHGKNLMRVFVALVLEGKKEKAKEIMQKAITYPISRKAKIMLSIFKINYMIGSVTLKTANVFGLISL